jgi:hypothetical protein
MQKKMSLSEPEMEVKNSSSVILDMCKKNQYCFRL